MLALTALWCFFSLEIVDSTKWQAPSRAARLNRYLALERWLAASGREVRTENRRVNGLDTILSAPEKIVFIETSSFAWGDARKAAQPDFSALSPWVQEGGALIISVDTGSLDWKLRRYLETLGVTDMPPDISDFVEGDFSAEEENAEPAEENLRDRDAMPELSGMEFFLIEPQPPNEGEAPAVEKSAALYDWDYVPEKDGTIRQYNKVLVDKDAILFVRLDMGKGFIAVTGNAHFLENFSIAEPPNAALAASLFLDNGIAGGVLLVPSRGDERHLFGSLAERGNPRPLFIAAAVLIIAGFWMAIPAFGRARPAPARPGKPLRERFLAEGRFLAKYGALSKYFELYGASDEKPSVQNLMKVQGREQGKIATTNHTNDTNLTNKQKNGQIRQNNEAH